MNPKRIKRARTKGFCFPDDTVYVGRSTMFGNPFSAAEVGYEKAVKLFVAWIAGDLDTKYPDLVPRREKLVQRLPSLQGKNLACWCDLNKPCHVDILLVMLMEKTIDRDKLG